MNNKPTKIEAGQTLTARSACDYDCIFKVEILERNKSFCNVRVQGQVKRVKIHNFDGVEGIYALGRFSMAPYFRASTAAA
jgi:hypothetical protein